MQFPDSCQCSFSPSHLKDALSAQQRGGYEKRFRNNELVFGAASVVANLPNSILAFFYTTTSVRGQVDEVYRVREQFIKAYALGARDLAPPVVSVDLLDQGAKRPFRCETCD